jgi:alpha-L-rhamnosidase
MKRELLVLILFAFGALSVSFSAYAERARFAAAKAVWPKGRAKEKNLFVGFRAILKPGGDAPVVLRLTASSLYRASVNGRFVGYGPARAPHGHFRVDEWDITPHLVAGPNVIAVEVAGYNVNSFYTLDAPSFLQAEIVSDGKVLAATGGEGASFEARILDERIQKVQRYSFMRAFSEAYRPTPGDAWKTDPAAAFPATKCTELAGVRRLLPRRVPYPRFAVRSPLRHVSHGTIQTGIKVRKLYKDRGLTGIGPKLGGYREKELEVVPFLELQTIASTPTTQLNRRVSPRHKVRLPARSYRILDFGTNLTGFVGATVTCRKKTRLFITFDEVLTDGDVDFRRLGCVNIVTYELAPGRYRLESFEAYTLRYLKLIVLEGDCTVENVSLREYANPDVWEAHFAASDPRLNRLFEAGRETFRQNAVDVFMDCPSRERGGYLCDAFFTARVAYDLAGTTPVEHNFFEAYLLPEKFAFLPDGMLPMCYPADHNDGLFIPNWALWFIVQLEEYLARSGDRDTVDALRPRVLKLLDYFKPFRNTNGLLEKLDGWVFIEWSKANKFTQDVNYPSNMLYAAALAAVARMYDRPKLARDAEKIRNVIRKQSFDGTFFVDNAERKGGRLRPTRNRSEVCQYYAFFFDVATPRTHPELWRTLCERFGPQRAQTGAYADVHATNSFIGNMLRVEVLSRYGKCRQILDESLDSLMYMAERTGTLWENTGAYASCNHGFASHIVHTLYRDVLGLYRLDIVRKQITLRFADVGLDWCEGRVPTPDGPVALRWRLENNRLIYRLDTPAGYTVKVQGLGKLNVVREQ